MALLLVVARVIKSDACLVKRLLALLGGQHLGLLRDAIAINLLGFVRDFHHLSFLGKLSCFVVVVVVDRLDVVVVGDACLGCCAAFIVIVDIVT